MMNIIYLIRGTSGSGKSTLAQQIKDLADLAKIRCVIATADDYFINRCGEYHFDATKLGTAHQLCQEKVDFSCCFGVPIVIVANTLTSESELKPYIEIAKQYQYKIVSVVLEKRHKNNNTHNVPFSTLEKQERRLRSSLKLI